MGLLAAAAAAVTLTLHPGQTLRIAHLHVGDVIVCRMPGDVVRWKATARNIRTTSWVWDTRLQLTIASRGTKSTASCQRR